MSRVDLYLALFENIFVPHLGPRLCGKAENLRESAQTPTFDRHGTVRAKDD